MNSDVAIGQPLERALWKLHDARRAARVCVLCRHDRFAGADRRQPGRDIAATCRIWSASAWPCPSAARRWRRKRACPRWSSGPAICHGSGYVYFIRPGFFRFFLDTPTGNHLLLVACRINGHGHHDDASNDQPEPRAMTPQQLSCCSGSAAAVVALVGVAFLLLFRGAEEHEIAARIAGCGKAAIAAQPRPRAILAGSGRRWSAHLGNALHDRMLSKHDAGALARTLAASGFEPSKAMPIFVGAKVACLFIIPPAWSIWSPFCSATRSAPAARVHGVGGDSRDVGAEMGGGADSPALSAGVAARHSRCAGSAGGLRRSGPRTRIGTGTGCSGDEEVQPARLAWNSLCSATNFVSCPTAG